MSTRIIHRPDEPHRCEVPRLDWVQDNCGVVVKCDDCGTVQVSYDGEYGIVWRYLRPWPFDRRIKRILREAGESDGEYLCAGCGDWVAREPDHNGHPCTFAARGPA